MTRALAIILRLDKTDRPVSLRANSKCVRESWEGKLGRFTRDIISTGEQQRRDRRFLARDTKFHGINKAPFAVYSLCYLLLSGVSSDITDREVSGRFSDPVRRSDYAGPECEAVR